MCIPSDMIQCLSLLLSLYEGVRGANLPKNLFSYCGAGKAGRCGAGVAMYINIGESEDVSMNLTASVLTTSVK